MNQNTSVIKWELVNPVKFRDKECGEVEVVAGGTFSYQIINQETFSASATQANMSQEDYAKGLLLSMVIEEINKFSGKMALSLSDFVKGDNVLLNGNKKVAVVGLNFTSVIVESIELTEESRKKMKDIETSKIKSAITGREIVNNKKEIDESNTVEESTEVLVSETALPEKKNGVLGILLVAIVVAILIMILFK